MTPEIRNNDGTWRGGRRRKQLPNDLVEKRRNRQLTEGAEQNAEINRTEITKHDTWNQKYRREGERREET